MGSDDGDNGAVTLDQTDMLPQGRRVIGFACEAGEGELGAHHTFQFDKKKNNDNEFWTGGRICTTKDLHFDFTSFLLFFHIHLNFLDFAKTNNNVLFGAFNFTFVHFHTTVSQVTH